MSISTKGSHIEDNNICTEPVLQSLVVALMLSCLDYGSIVLSSLPQQLVDKLQSVQNAAA